MDLTGQEFYIDLLAMVLKDKTGKVITEIATRYPTLKELAEAPWQELSTVQGIGPAKAKQISACLEIGKMLTRPQAVEKV